MRSRHLETFQLEAASALRSALVALSTGRLVLAALLVGLASPSASAQAIKSSTLSTSQDSKLSVLSSFRPGTLIHLGVSTPNTALDSCTVYYSTSPAPRNFTFHGVPFVVDLATAGNVHLLPQHLGFPPYSTEKKWRFDIVLPTNLPTNGPLYIQAVLRSSSNPSLISISNGLRVNFSSGPPEVHYGYYVSGGIGQTKSVHISQIDVDHGTVTPVPNDDIPGYEGWLMEKTFQPTYSDDGRFVVIPNVMSQGVGGLGAGVMYLFDTFTGSGEVLDQPTAQQGGVPVQYWNLFAARFQPGVNNRVWTLARTAQCPSREEFRLCSYDTATGDLVATFNLSGNVLLCQPGRIGYKWDFDSTGQYVCFNDDFASLIVYPISGGTPGTGTVYPLDASGVISGTSVDIRPIPNSTRALITYTAGVVRRVVYFDLANGAKSAVFTGPAQYGVRFGAIASDGTYAVMYQFNDGSTGPLDLLAIKTNQPVVPNMELSATGIPYPYPGQVHHFALGQGGDILVGGNDGSKPVARLRLDNLGTPVSTVMSQTTHSGWNFAFTSLEDFNTFFVSGQWVRLKTRNGILVQSRFPNNAYGLDLLDVETMTHAALGFTLPNGTSDLLGGPLPAAYVGPLIF